LTAIAGALHDDEASGVIADEWASL
jgi:hypothetical protein